MSSRTYSARETEKIVARAVETALAAVAQRPTATVAKTPKHPTYQVQVVRITSGKQYDATLAITGTRKGPRGGRYVLATLTNGKATRKIEISGGQYDRFESGAKDEMLVPIDSHMWTITRA